MLEVSRVLILLVLLKEIVPRNLAFRKLDCWCGDVKHICRAKGQQPILLTRIEQCEEIQIEPDREFPLRHQTVDSVSNCKPDEVWPV